jgi:hypothetical protein
MHRNEKTMAIYFEHPEWFRPLFAEFDRRGTVYVIPGTFLYAHLGAASEASVDLPCKMDVSRAWSAGDHRGTHYCQPEYKESTGKIGRVASPT